MASTVSTLVMVAARDEAFSTSSSYTTWVKPSLPLNGIGEPTTDATTGVNSSTCVSAACPAAGSTASVEPPHAVIETATAKVPRAHNDAWNVREAFICLSFLGGLLSPIGAVASREAGTTGEKRVIRRR